MQDITTIQVLIIHKWRIHNGTYKQWSNSLKGWNVIQYRCQQTQNIFRDSIFGDDKSKIQMLINEVDLDHPKQVMPWIVRKNVYWVLTTIVDDKNSTFD